MLATRVRGDVVQLDRIALQLQYTMFMSEFLQAKSYWYHRILLTTIFWKTSKVVTKENQEAYNDIKHIRALVSVNSVAMRRHRGEVEVGTWQELKRRLVLTATMNISIRMILWAV